MQLLNQINLEKTRAKSDHIAMEGHQGVGVILPIREYNDIIYTTLAGNYGK